MNQIKSKGKWKVILTQGVRKLGKKGDVLEVKHGFFRNFLSKGYAVSYDENVEKEIGLTLKSTFDDKYEAQAVDIESKIKDQYVFFARQASGTDVMYGSVSTKDISNEIKINFGVTVPANKIWLENSIKKLGIYDFTVDLTEKVCFKMFLSVGRSMEEAQKNIEK